MSSDDLARRLEMLERSVLEMGTEVYQLKGMLGKAREYRDRFLAVMRGLKQLLDEKGLITVEDFDAAVELGEVLERFNTPVDQLQLESEKAKKPGH